MDKNTQIQNWIGSCMEAAFALIFLGAELMISLISLNIIKTLKKSFNAPRFIVLAAGTAFFLAGFFISLGVIFPREELRLPAMLWIQYFISLAIMICFCALFLRTRLGPGEHEFQTSTTNRICQNRRPRKRWFWPYTFGRGRFIMQSRRDLRSSSQVSCAENSNPCLTRVVKTDLDGKIAEYFV